MLFATHTMRSSALVGPARVAALLLASSFTLFALTAAAPVLPAIEQAFADVPGAALLSRLVLTLPALSVAATVQYMDRPIERYGSRPVLVGALVLYAVSGSAGIWLDGLISILLSRAALGVAIAGLLAALSAVVDDYFAGAARYRMTGAQVSATLLAGALGCAVVGGSFAGDTWRLPFYLHLGALLAVPLAAFGMPEPLRVTAAQVIEPEGPVMLPMWRGLAVYLLAAASLLIVFMVPSQLAFLVATTGAGGPREAGLAIAAFMLAAAAGALGSRRRWQRAGPAALLAGGYGLLALGFAIAATADVAALTMVAMVVAGAGFATLAPTFNAWMLAIAPARLRGRAVGGITTSLFLGAGLSPLYSQPLAGLVGLPGAFAVSAAVLAALSAGFAVAAITAYLARRRHI